jgi:hypothetical protein
MLFSFVLLFLSRIFDPTSDQGSRISACMTTFRRNMRRSLLMLEQLIAHMVQAPADRGRGCAGVLAREAYAVGMGGPGFGGLGLAAHCFFYSDLDSKAHRHTARIALRSL